MFNHGKNVTAFALIGVMVAELLMATGFALVGVPDSSCARMGACDIYNSQLPVVLWLVAAFGITLVGFILISRWLLAPAIALLAIPVASVTNYLLSDTMNSLTRGQELPLGLGTGLAAILLLTAALLILHRPQLRWVATATLAICVLSTLIIGISYANSDIFTGYLFLP
jgi:hypothetical protein